MLLHFHLRFLSTPFFVLLPNKQFVCLLNLCVYVVFGGFSSSLQLAFHYLISFRAHLRQQCIMDYGCIINISFGIMFFLFAPSENHSKCSLFLVKIVFFFFLLLWLLCSYQQTINGMNKATIPVSMLASIRALCMCWLCIRFY